MKASICKIMVGVALVLSPVKAMYEEEALKFPQAKLAQHNINIAPQMSYKEYPPFETLPDELFVSVFRFLDINDLGRVAQVSARWKKVAEDPDLWRYMGSRYYGDYLSKEDLREDPKQKVIYHYLSVVVFAATDLEKIDCLVRCYGLNSYTPSFRKCEEKDSLSFLTDLITDYAVTHFSSCEELIAQGNRLAIDRKIDGLCNGKNGYERNPLAAKEFNDSLVAKLDTEAIKRKIDDIESAGIYCESGPYGYKKDPVVARELNELLAAKGNQRAINRKIMGFFYGRYGYQKDPVAAKRFKDFLAAINNSLVEKGDAKAIERKIEGLASGQWGYEEDPSVAREFNEFLVEKGDARAIERKIEGLFDGKYGYEKDKSTARKLNELLIENGDLKAIKRKIDRLSRKDDPMDTNRGRRYAALYANQLTCKVNWPADWLVFNYNDGKDPLAARNFIEQFIKKNNQDAIKSKINGLDGGLYGYDKDPVGCKDFNESLIIKENAEAIKTKIKGLTEGKYGYKKDPIAARELIEYLLISEIPHVRAIGKYIKAFAMKYGVTELGYEKDSEKAIEFIKHNHIPY